MSESFDAHNTHLPVTEVIEDVRRVLRSETSLILTAPPGAGKSTVLPLALMDEDWLDGKKIIMLEPRRLAASSVANRMAELLLEVPGDRVGYRIRFETKISSRTRIEVVTEGVLTRMLQDDNVLEDVGLIIFDEFHERSIHADLAFALCREVQQVLRPDLRLLVMSATVDVRRLSELMQAAVLTSQGRTFPVEMVYTGDADPQVLPRECSRVIARAMKEHGGDVLVFLPGQAEINRTAALLQDQPGFVLHLLYGQLSNREQQAALQPDAAGRRKVVLATSIAETSLTIEGVRVVVDCGFTRKPAFDPGTGLSGLKTVRITNDSAEQRAGRAGRLAPGVCYRMWTMATQQRLEPYRRPEILESDLTPLVLELARWGATSFSDLQWLDIPAPGALNYASDLLEKIGALSAGRITAYGREVHRLPAHPRIANMLISAKQSGHLALATDMAAILEEKDPLDRRTAGVDLVARVESLRRYRASKNADGRWEKIEKTAAAYRRIMNIPADNNWVGAVACSLLLSKAYPERVASRKAGKEPLYQMANGRTAMIDREDALSDAAWLAIGAMDAEKGRIFLATALDPSDLMHLGTPSVTVKWDNRKGRLLTNKDIRIGSIVLQSQPITDPDPDLIRQALADAVKNYGRQLLEFTPQVEAWQNRVLNLRIWNPDQNWPDVSTDALIDSNEEWLSPYLTNVRKTEDFKKIDLLNVLKHSLSYEQQNLLDRLAPQTVEVPSGSHIAITYSATGDQPVLAVRLQELFGMTETPVVNEGRTNLLIHLLSPGFKPVQVTADLKSFWSNVYFEVRKDLKRRYPKHSWPENPLEAEAVRGVRRKTQG